MGNNTIGIVCSPVQLTAGVTINGSGGSHYSKIKNKELIDYIMDNMGGINHIIIYGPEAYTSKIKDKINQAQMKKYKKQQCNIELRSKLY